MARFALMVFVLVVGVVFIFIFVCVIRCAQWQVTYI
jgi:hypothetical protein